MSSPTPSFTTMTPKTRPRRESKFTEGSPLTGPDLLQQTPTSNDFFFTILSQMDEHERRRKHRDSNSSVESFAISNRSHLSGPNGGGEHEFVPKQGRRSITFGSRSADLVRRSLDDRPREHAGLEGVEALANKVKGRLRALTNGKERERNAKP